MRAKTRGFPPGNFVKAREKREMLRVVCQHCGTRCRVAAAKVPVCGARVCCPACRQIFFLKPPGPLKNRITAGRRCLAVFLDRAARRLRGWQHRGRKGLQLAAARRLELGLVLLLLLELPLAGMWCRRQPAAVPVVSATLALPPAVVSQKLLHQVVAEIKNHQLVGDAAISQEKEQFFLSLLVNRAAPPAWAARLGRQFLQAANKVAIRNLKGYHFHLHIYYPDGREITPRATF